MTSPRHPERSEGSLAGGQSRPPAARPDVAVGLIVDDQGRLLLQHRDQKPGLPGAGLWGLFGGGVEPDDGSPSRAFLREVEEELGWRPRHFEPYTTRDVDRDGWRVRSHVFAAHLDVPLSVLDLREGQAMDLFPPDAPPPDVIPSIGALIRDFAATDAYNRVRRRWDAMTTAGLLIDREGRFLLQHRDDKPGIANPGKWGSFGGELEPYETPQEGFARELREELAWEPRTFALQASYPYTAGGKRHLIYVFTALVDAAPDSLVLGEGQAMGFFTPEALPPETVPELAQLIVQFAGSPEYRSLVRQE